jgi:uncharacterized protein
VNPLTDVFADSVFWIGFVFDRDQHHASAIEQAALIHGNIVTSHPVLVETINSLSKPAWRDVIILYPTPLHWQTAWQMFILHSDKGWSYTDCCSFVLMREQGLTRALTADQHFRQAGFAVLL